MSGSVLVRVHFMKNFFSMEVELADNEGNKEMLIAHWVLLNQVPRRRQWHHFLLLDSLLRMRYSCVLRIWVS